MKKMIIPALILILFVVVFSLLSIKNKPKPVMAPQIDIALQQKLIKNAYASKMLRLLTRARNIVKAKFMYHSKEKDFFPKKDIFGNAAAVDFYVAQKGLLESIKKEVSDSAAPDKYKPVSAGFTEALDAGIASFDKAIESLQKDDASIMKERPPLAQKCDDLLTEVVLNLQK